MSHFIRIKTQIREREMLTKTLRDLHYAYQEGENLVVRGWMGKNETAQVVVNTHSNYDIGFKRQNDVYDVVADWWGVHKDTPIRQAEFLRQVCQQYGFNVMQDQAVREHCRITSREMLDSGELVLILERDYS